MKTRLVTLNLILMLMLVGVDVSQAQQSQQPIPFPVNLSVDLNWQKQTLNLREDQWETSFSRPVVNFRAGTQLTRALWFQYQLTTRLATAETIIPAGSLVIVGIDLSQQQASSGSKLGGKSQDQTKPVTIDYTSGCDHAVVLTWLINYPVQPLVYTKFATARIDATGEKDGQPLTASESFNRTFWGVGLALNIWPETPNISRVAPNIWFAVGDKYSKVEGTLSTPLWRDVGLRIGGFYEHMDYGELRVRNTGFVFGGEWRF